MINFSFASPISIEFSGIVDSIIDLLEAKPNNNMQEEEGISEQNEHLAEGYVKNSRPYQVINDPGTPEEIRTYPNAGLERLLEQQATLNHLLDIRYDKTDIKNTGTYTQLVY